MKSLANKVKRFFFPPAGSPTWVRLTPYIILGALTIILLMAGAYGWEYTNSPEFCGTSCHTMPPEYTAYLTSPHARIACVDCHIGKGFIATRITRKAGDLKHVFATTFQTYKFPIRAHDLRPARETCELCHFPDKFADDSLREIKTYKNDLENSPVSIYLTLRTGGGNQREGLGRGIHWHIQNKVTYFATDLEEQEIPYVKVENNDGSFQEFIDIETGFEIDQIAPEDIKEMDCITCHNRITHLVLRPSDTIDMLISRGQISREIPEIRRMAIEVYGKIYSSVEEGQNAIAGMEDYYRVYHTKFYKNNSPLITQTIQVLQDAYAVSVYPEQNSDWTTHPNNIGHADSPGCFRCHDGQHLNSENKAIRLECNLCHSIPVVAGPYDFTARLEISRGPEPQSHLNENWISLHNQVFDSNCIKCHTTDDPGGTSNNTFCSNSACHGNVWEYAGFDAPALREVLISQLPPQPTPQAIPLDAPLTFQASIGPLMVGRCGPCHGVNGLQNLNLTTYESVLQGGKNGPAIVPGNPQKSLLISVQMGSQPHFGQFHPDELELINQWILAGAPEN